MNRILFWFLALVVACAAVWLGMDLAEYLSEIL
jgi:hypothetical protein